VPLLARQVALCTLDTFHEWQGEVDAGLRRYQNVHREPRAALLPSLPAESEAHVVAQFVSAWLTRAASATVCADAISAGTIVEQPSPKTGSGT
jgi:hypothetical protein